MRNPFKKENLEQEVITLHIPDKNIGKKVVVVVKRQLYIGLTIVTLFMAGSLYSYSRYRINTEKLQATSIQLEEVNSNLTALVETKKSLEEKSAALEEENSAYNQELEQLKNKANEIQNKINDLNKAKDELYNKLEEVSVEEPQNAQMRMSLDTGDLDLDSDFTEMVITPYNCENTKTEFVKTTLLSLENSIDTEKVAYIDVANEVTETLAKLTSVPSIWPVTGNVSSEFGYRSDPINSSAAFHPALDIRVSIGTPVKATASGRVVVSEFNNSGYGYMVEIDHGNGYTTLYAHNSELNVSVGDQVEQGDIIAHSGATGRVTGPHVHYEILINNEYQNPRDFIK